MRLACCAGRAPAAAGKRKPKPKYASPGDDLSDSASDFSDPEDDLYDAPTPSPAAKPKSKSRRIYTSPLAPKAVMAKAGHRTVMAAASKAAASVSDLCGLRPPYESHTAGVSINGVCLSVDYSLTVDV